MLQVSCVSDGARPAVKFSWMLGEDPYTGEVKDLAEQTKEDGSVKQVQEVQYIAEPGHNGKRLVCSVENRGFTVEDIDQGRNQASLQLDVQFQPVAADQPEIFYNVKTGESKDILMNFRAHPRPSTVSKGNVRTSLAFRFQYFRSSGASLRALSWWKARSLWTRTSRPRG